MYVTQYWMLPKLLKRAACIATLVSCQTWTQTSGQAPPGNYSSYYYLNTWQYIASNTTVWGSIVTSSTKRRKV